MNKPNAPGEGSELPARPYLTEDGNGDKRHYPSDMTDAFIEALERRIAELQTKCAYQDAELKAALSSPQQESAEFRWIPCEQELPPIGETVIVCGGIAYRVDGEWISQTGSSSGRPIMWSVTHWAKIPYIPAPPVTAEGKDRG